MAKKHRNGFSEIRGAIDDMRTGLNDVDKSVDRVELARLARILGFVMLVAGLLYVIITLQRLGVL